MSNLETAEGRCVWLHHQATVEPWLGLALHALHALHAFIRVTIMTRQDV